MQSSDWGRLAAPFPPSDVNWRIEELAVDGTSARVRAQLPARAIVARLDEVVGRSGWSLRYRAIGNGVCCELTIGGTVKSAVCEPRHDNEGAESASASAFAQAAELFGLVASPEAGGECWVDYDPQEQIAFTPELSELDGTNTEPTATPTLPSSETGADRAVKPEGQQAIDRLLERLKVEGQGLEAARLLVRFGGYGSDPETARELYGKLRELLTRRSERAPAEGST